MSVRDIVEVYIAAAKEAREYRCLQHLAYIIKIYVVELVMLKEEGNVERPGLVPDIVDRGCARAGVADVAVRRGPDVQCHRCVASLHHGEHLLLSLE